MTVARSLLNEFIEFDFQNVGRKVQERYSRGCVLFAVSDFRCAWHL